eukprot:COSAG03_NODE_7964_length_851_cov_1.174202_1_plen_49_part_01
MRGWVRAPGEVSGLKRDVPDRTMAEPARSKPEEGQKEEERKLEPAGPPA